jgi:hypothetical protein
LLLGIYRKRNYNPTKLINPSIFGKIVTNIHCILTLYEPTQNSLEAL